MVGYTPSLSTAVWVGTTDRSPLRNYGGAMIYGSGLPSDIWKGTMDGALEGTDVEKFPTPGRSRARPGGVPAVHGSVHRRRRRRRRPAGQTTDGNHSAARWSTHEQVEILPGIDRSRFRASPRPTTDRRRQDQAAGETHRR